MNDVSIEQITDDALMRAYEWHTISSGCYDDHALNDISKEIITGEKTGSCDAYRHWHIVNAMFQKELKRRVNIEKDLSPIDGTKSTKGDWYVRNR